MSTIVRLEANNVKRLKAVRIDPKGATVVIGGKNAAGKSSVLDAINMALGGKNAVPSKPLREGSDKGSIVLETQEIIVTRKFNKSGTTSLEVTNKDGLQYKSPQDVLDKLCASIAFDPLTFIRDGETPEGRKRQLGQLRSLVGIDTTAIEVARRKAFDDRTVQNRRVKEQEALVNSLPATGPERVDTAAVLAEMEAAESRNQEIAERKRMVTSAQQQLETSVSAAQDVGETIFDAEQNLDAATSACERSKQMFAQQQELANNITVIDLEPLRKALAEAEENNRKKGEADARVMSLRDAHGMKVEQVKRLQATLQSATDKAEGLKKRNADLADRAKKLAAADTEEPTDLGKYRKILREAEATNAMAAKVEQRKAEAAKLVEITKVADQMTDDIDRLDKSKLDMIAGAKFPVPDLGFGEDGVLYKGLPLEQASSAEKLRVGLAIACAVNPSLKVMLIRDGSLLDEDSMAIVAEMAEAAGAQVWLEIVTTDKGRCTVVIEDGEVQA